MTDIFISYSREDNDWVARLEQAFKAKGYSVWRDVSNILAGDDFRQTIPDALDQAACVIVVWSQHSVTSKWVKAEADRADKRDVLVPVNRDGVDNGKIPLPFGNLHAPDMSTWDGGLEHPVFAGLLQAVSKHAIPGTELPYDNVLRLLPTRLSEEEARKSERQYLERMMQDCMGLEWLRLVRKQDENTPVLGLDSVYTALLTTTLEQQGKADRMDERRQRRLSSLEVLNLQQKLVLTGTPGSGKSAFVNYLALCLAGENLQDQRANLQALTEPLPDNNGNPQSEEVEVPGKKEKQKREIRQPWDHKALIPVRIILRDFSASPHFPATERAADAQCLLDFLQTDLHGKACGDYFKILQARLLSGEALAMFDGLDEVPQAGERRKRLVACIDGFVKSFGKARFLVTCRPYAYEKPEWKLARFAESHLAEFTRGQMIRFIQRWYGNSWELDEDARQERAERLKGELFRRESLYKLAERPLLLSLIIYLHAYRYRLPDHRAELYEDLLDLLIDQWERARFKVDDFKGASECEQYSLAQYLRIGQKKIRQVLERLAFQAHAKQEAGAGQQTADIAADQLSHELVCAAEGEVDVSQVREYLCNRVGILYQRGGSSARDAVYTFPHRSFQEYLAASYFRLEDEKLFSLNEEVECRGWQDMAAYLGKSDPDRWREVVILAGGIDAQTNPRPVWDLLDALYPEPVDELSQGDAWGLRLAGEILAESVDTQSVGRFQKPVLQRIRTDLPMALRTLHLKAIERVAIGNYLAAIGDPRPEIMDVDAMLFCHVPAGAFWLGKGAVDKDDEQIGKETPAGEYDLNYAYWMAKHPVTVAQFRQFVVDSKHKPDSGDRWQGKDNDPVVYVTWHDAVAFCQWLNGRWSLPGWRVTLPNEPEWEKVARGGLQVPAAKVVEAVKKIPPNPPFAKGGMEENPLPQLRYPWGDEDNEERLNYNMKVDQVSTPGAYPAGQSVYGCEDLSGNVWEWSRSQYADYPYPPVGTEEWKKRESWDSDATRNARRVLRGGAFDFSPRLVRSAVRDFNLPVYWDVYIGFQVCLSPFL